MAGEAARKEARDRIRKAMEKMLDQHIPEDPSKPVKDGKFWEWEEMGDEFDRAVTSAFIEEMACLSGTAKLDHPGACPFCRSKHVRWLKFSGQRERQSKHGPVVLPRQMAQCRSCDRSFSPSGTGLGPGPGARINPSGADEGVP